MPESRIGPITLTFRHKGQLIDWQASEETADLGGIEVPRWITHRQHGVSGPDMVVRVEIRDGSPALVELSFQAQPGQGEVREKHLRAVNVDQLASDLYAECVAEFGTDPSREEMLQAMRLAAKFIERQRLPRDYRVLNDEVLRKVAEVYRGNISHAPTQAVAKHFGVKARMASTYVDRARKAGHLPKTKQGRKQA